MNQALYAMLQRAEPWESTRPTRKRDLHARGGVGFSNRVLYSRQPLLKWINSMQFPYAGIGISVGLQSTPAWICIIVKVTQPVKAGTPGFHEVKFSSSVSVWESGDFSTLQLWEERIDHSLLRAVARWLRSCRVLYIVVGTNCSCDDVEGVRWKTDAWESDAWDVTLWFLLLTRIVCDLLESWLCNYGVLETLMNWICQGSFMKGGNLRT